MTAVSSMHQRQKDKDELLQEIWPRETKPCLEYQVIHDSEEIRLCICQDLMGCRWDYQLGNIVWDAGHAMHTWLCKEFPQGYFHDKRILELGSGTGLVGLTLTALGAHVILTDLPVMLPLLRHNVVHCFPPDVLARHELQKPQVEPLPWGTSLPAAVRQPFDIVIGADITYDLDAMVDLLKTIQEVCGVGTVLYIGFLGRGGESVIFDWLEDRGWEVKEGWRISVGEDGMVGKHFVRIYEGSKRQALDSSFDRLTAQSTGAGIDKVGINA